MSGFDELWTHYQGSIQAVETPQKSAWVLLTVLFIVKYFPTGRRLMIAIVLRMRDRWWNGHNDLMGLWEKLLKGGIMG